MISFSHLLKAHDQLHHIKLTQLDTRYEIFHLGAESPTQLEATDISSISIWMKSVDCHYFVVSVANNDLEAGYVSSATKPV